MHIRGALAVASLTLALAVGCSSDEATVSTDTTPTDATPSDTLPSTDTATTGTTSTGVTTTERVTTTTSTAPTTTTTSTTTTSVAQLGGVPDPAAVLVVDVDGVWLWADGDRRLVIEGAVGSAIPDRAGGIVYQEVETGVWRADQSAPPPNAAQWNWVGTGSAQPIRRVLRPGGDSEVVVEPPPDGMVRIVDTAIVDDAPTLAYLRTRHFELARDSEENPWWDSRIAELVVHDLNTGGEEVVRSQSVGWEYDQRIPTLGEDVVAESVRGYGEGGGWIELLAFDGTPVDVIDDVPGCDFLCPLVADLAPTGPQLAYGHPRPSDLGPIEHEVSVAVLDHRSGTEEMRADLALAEGMGVVCLDTVGGRVLAVPGSLTPQGAAAGPVLRVGDSGPWVVVLQQRMSQVDLLGWDDTYLAPDGLFGSNTEATVRAFQTDIGLPADGIVGAETWARLVAESGSIVQLHDPVLIDTDGSSRPLPVLPSGVTPARGFGPAMTLWSE